MINEPKSVIVHPFLRQVEVVIGPLPEYKGGGDESKGVRLFGDGTPGNFRIKFQINKPWLPSNIQVYNLGPELRNSLHTDKAQMLVRAGWQNTGMIDVFKGSLLASYNTRQGADIVTDLIGFSGWYSKASAINSVTFGEGTSLKSMITTLAMTLEGVSIDSKRIDIADINVGSGGDSDAGLTEERLNKLSRIYGFVWGIDMGVFYAIDNSRYFKSGSTPVISNKNGYLIRAEPMLSSPIPQKTGVSVSSLFQPFVNPWEIFSLDSLVNPDLNGDYVCHSVTHTGDTHSDSWNTEIQSWIIVNTQGIKAVQVVDWNDIEVLAGTIYGEASGESQNGKIAVALTIRNRVEHLRWWGSGWKGVCQKKSDKGTWQFSCWGDSISRITKAKRDDTPMWKDCMNIAKSVMAGNNFNVGLTNTPTHFHATNITPSWAKSLQFIGTIGGHHFYHDPAIG